MRVRAPFFAALLVPLALAFACQSVPPAPDGHDSEASASDKPANAQIVERMLAFSVGGQTIGVVETRLEKAADGTWTSREFVTLSMVRQGGGDDAAFSSTTESVSVYGPDHEFVSEVEIEREAGITVTRTITREGDEMVSGYSGPGREDVKRFPLPADYRSSLAVDFELIAQWNATKQPVSAEYSSFDASRERFEVAKVTLTGETTFEFDGKQVPAYTFQTRDEDGTTLASIVDHDLVPLKVEAAGSFMAVAVTTRPEFGGTGGGKINSELPVTGTTTSRWWELAKQEVAVTVDGDDPTSPTLWEPSHYHEVVRDGTNYKMTLLSTRPDKGFVSPLLPLKAVDADVKRYLEPTAMAQSDDAKIVAKAKAIVGTERDGLAAASRIVEAVFSGIDKQAGVRGSATASEVLANGAGDCTEHAVLVVALMRAAGIPARVVDGIVVLAERDGKGVAGYHAWAEIWLGEWIGVDATVNETGTSARYLAFGIDEPGSMGSGGKMMRSIGKTKIEFGPHQTYEEQTP